MIQDLNPLLNTFEQWVVFCGEFKGLSETQRASSLEPGKWSVKDIVAHMMRWDQYFYESAILKIAAGDRLTLQHLNYDEFNQEAMKYAVSVPAEELVKKAIDVRMNIIGAIRDMPEDKKVETYTDVDGKEFFIPQYLKAS